MSWTNREPWDFMQEQVADELIAAKQAEWRNAKHRDQWRATLEKNAAALRSRPIQALAPGERQEWIAIYPSEISGRRFHRVLTAPRSNG